MQPTDRARSKTFVPHAFSSTAALDKHRVAVLPLQNISPDPKDEYFADGMTEELISTMSKIAGLKVVARTSVMGYKGVQKKIEEIARELKVGTILEGSVRKAGDKLRITVQLIDSESSDHLWSESYDREMKDVFAIQSDISQTVAEALKVKLLPIEKERLEKEPTKNVEAYELYLKGLETAPWIMAGLPKENMERSREYFERAIKLDPNFALAYAALSLCYRWGFRGSMRSDERSSKQDAAARKALEIDDDLAEAHYALAGILWGKNDFQGHEKEIKRAIELKPNYAFAHMSYGNHCMMFGRFDEAQIELRKARELDPHSSQVRRWMRNLLIRTRQYDQALEEIAEEMKLHDRPDLHDELAQIYLVKGAFENALIESEKAVAAAAPEDRPLFTSTLACIYARTGRKEEAIKILRELEDVSKQGYFRPESIVAPVYYCLGDYDETLRIFEKAHDEHSAGISWINSPFYDELRSDPRFIALLKKVGLEK